MKHFNLFSNILITRGASRILISDLQRNTSDLYPLELYDVIEELKNNSIEELLKAYDAESKIILQKYISLLLEKEYGFITFNDWDKNFPVFSSEYHDPDILSNVIIETDSLDVLYRIKKSVENLEIKYLVILYGKELSVEEFIEIEHIFHNTPISGIEILSQYHNLIDKNFIQQLSYKVNRIYNLTFYNCKKNPFKVKDEFRFLVNFVKENITMSSCGKIDLKYFNTNLPKVLEAVNHNSCLYKKIAIDKNGNIKNCPAMSQNFGSIKETTLEEALRHKDFKKYWNISKDKIEVCKDCEFRYICTDCRAYTKQTHISKNGLDFSKPLKCGYNPYSGDWEEWSRNPLKHKR